MVVVCLSSEPGIHIGTGVTFPDMAEMCMDGPVDADAYNPDTRLFCAVTYPAGVSRPNIKTYFDEVLQKTYYGDPGKSGQFVWWNSFGWTGVVRFDFCDGDDMLCSRSTMWTDAQYDAMKAAPMATQVPEVAPLITPVPEVAPAPAPKPTRASIVRIDLPESATTGDRMSASVVVKNTSTVTLMFSVKIINADTNRRYGGFTYTPYIKPEKEAAVTIQLMMPDGTDPLNLVAKVYRGTTLQDRMATSVTRKIPAPAQEPEKEACYIKFDIPILDTLPGIPCEWWGLPLLPGFKKTKEP